MTLRAQSLEEAQALMARELKAQRTSSSVLPRLEEDAMLVLTHRVSPESHGLHDSHANSASVAQAAVPTRLSIVMLSFLKLHGRHA